MNDSEHFTKILGGNWRKRQVKLGSLMKPRNLTSHWTEHWRGEALGSAWRGSELGRWYSNFTTYSLSLA